MCGCAINGAIMIIDLTPYKKDLEGLDLTEQQKLELVNALWVIAENIIDKELGLSQADPRDMGEKYQEILKAITPKRPKRSRTKIS
jgi:hypothetical protein